jgi:hypothetical protein
MSDDLSKRGGQDRTRINVNQDYELRDWAKKFGITRDELKEEVRAAGSDRAPDVESPSRTRAATHSAKASQRNAAARSSAPRLGRRSLVLLRLFPLQILDRPGLRKRRRGGECQDCRRQIIRSH